MILGLGIIVAVLAIWLATACLCMWRLGVSFRQALLYAPFKLIYRIDDGRVREAREAATPVIYVIVHQSRLEPALMLSLLPEQTLHILDERSAKSAWLEPYRELARTIPFNTEHLFVSRRLVRHLRGKGRLAVYVPDEIEPDAKSFRLYRAIARIATAADARVVPIVVGGARHLPFSHRDAAKRPRRLLPRLYVTAQEPLTLAELSALSAEPSPSANTLFDRIAEARLYSANLDRGLFKAIRTAGRHFGLDKIAIEDVVAPPLTYRRLFIGARILGLRIAAKTAPGEAVGLLLPNSGALATTLLGLFSSGRVATMINYTSGPAAITAAVRTATIRTIIASRAFVVKADLNEVVEAAEKGGARMLWLEDVRADVSPFDKVAAFLQWRRPIARTNGATPAAILFTSGSETHPKAVVLSNRNLHANAMQAAARLDFSPQDTLLNVLPMFHSFGLTAGTILPLLVGVKTVLYPSPLHYRLIPETAAKVKPTIMVGTDTFLNGYARAAQDSDFASLRLVVAGAEPVKAETRRVWRERFGAEIVEGFGLTEASPVVAVNTATHNRDGSVGRLLPGIRTRIEPVEGISDGGQLWIRGPNIMQGYIEAERPGALLQPRDGWHDTGDIVAFDREGYVFIRGRAKRFAKIGGEMVSLGAIEMLAQGLWPEEKHAVVAVPDRRKGERVVLITTADEAKAADLRREGKSRGISGLMVPDDVIPVDEIPVLGSGKTDYAAVKRLALQRLGLDKAA